MATLDISKKTALKYFKRPHCTDSRRYANNLFEELFAMFADAKVTAPNHQKSSPALPVQLLLVTSANPLAAKVNQQARW
jgi:hypothetical protein